MKLGTFSFLWFLIIRFASHRYLVLPPNKYVIKHITVFLDEKSSRILSQFFKQLEVKRVHMV